MFWSVVPAVFAQDLFLESHGDASVQPELRGVHFGSAASGSNVMQLHLMKDHGLSGMGAVCLDGTDAGFYFAPAANASDANNWQLYFQGGGWCYDEVDCWGRAGSNLGSSQNWPSSVSADGIMSDNCGVNPDFCNFNRVFLAYCDGNSFAGNRDQPVKVMGPDGTQRDLYFRGRRVLDAVLETLMPMGLEKAERVLLTGCSAGGLAAYLHTDYVHEQLTSRVPTLRVFKSAPISGFFLRHDTVEGKAVYEAEMKSIFLLSNATHGLNNKCVQAMTGSEWKCNFADMAYQFTEANIFPLNSALDSWQTICVWTAELVPGFPNQTTIANGNCSAAAGWEQCSKNPEQCTSDQITKANQYITDFQTVMSSSVVHNKAGNGAFVHSCHTHCEAQTAAWNTFAVDGVTMQQAVSSWWNSDGTEPASQHTYQSCLYHATSPHKCNPTC